MMLPLATHDAAAGWILLHHDTASRPPPAHYRLYARRHLFFRHASAVRGEMMDVFELFSRFTP